MHAAERLWRRHFLSRTTLGIGTAALAGLLDRENPGTAAPTAQRAQRPHVPPRARRVIYLFMSGGPSQIDLFDPKPNLLERFDEELPESVRMGQRLTTMTAGQRRFPIAPSRFRFAQHGQSGAWISELLPHLSTVADELAIVRTVHTDAINHDPAITFLQTGSQVPGRPSLGSWVSYGLGSANDQLPTFAVLQSRWSASLEAQALSARLWGTGFLPTRHAGVALRSEGAPVLYLADPPGVSRALRRDMLDGLARLNQLHLADSGDPSVADRIAQYELAFRMQDAIPQLANFADEPRHILDLYGPDVQQPGSFAANCLLARRLAQHDVRFIQVFIRGWDHHADLPRDLALQCRDVDQATAALIRDLRQHGLLEETLVVWGGEFGRTTYCQGKLTAGDYGRDHHPRCFTMLLAGGGIRPGISYGQTDEFGYNIADRPVHIHDLNATILHCLGLDHRRLVFRFQGRDFRLTDVHGHVVRELLS
jgi:uncharacterized protein (DUF1501 family)